MGRPDKLTLKDLNAVVCGELKTKRRIKKEEEEMAEKGYCVKCKEMKEMKDEQRVTMKNGRAAAKGKCPDCGTGMYKILGKK